MSMWMKSDNLLVSLHLTHANVSGGVIGACSVCRSPTNVDVIIMISAVADDQVTAVSLHQLMQVKGEA